LIPPHEDLWLTCEMQDADRRVIDTTGSAVSVDSMRTIFDYVIGDAIPGGDYSLVLKIGNEEIIRRPFRVISLHKTAQLAN
ncbi:MAG TPA: hypothetical protein VFG04_30130, partial [Planctomycetaceae bacterium]|nr:hypothetical protein [Planctomycetaceae bacterium]